MYADYYMNRDIRPQDFHNLEDEDLDEEWGYELHYPSRGRPFYEDQRADVFRVRGRWIARGLIKNISVYEPENKNTSAAIMDIEMLHGEAWSLPTEFNVHPSDFENICLPADIEDTKSTFLKWCS